MIVLLIDRLPYTHSDGSRCRLNNLPQLDTIRWPELTRKEQMRKLKEAADREDQTHRAQKANEAVRKKKVTARILAPEFWLKGQNLIINDRCNFIASNFTLASQLKTRPGVIHHKLAELRELTEPNLVGASRDWAQLEL